MLDEKLLRKALEQAEAMAQVARQMAARGAPVPLMPETVFSKQVGRAPLHTPLHTPLERLDRGRDARRAAPREGGVDEAGASGRWGAAPEHALRTATPPQPPPPAQ